MSATSVITLGADTLIFPAVAADAGVKSPVALGLGWLARYLDDDEPRREALASLVILEAATPAKDAELTSGSRDMGQHDAGIDNTVEEETLPRIEREDGSYKQVQP